MTKEKKFRVWDKIANKMYYAGDGKFSIDLSGSLYDDSQTPPLNIDYRCVPLDYTGLKDKNGKEIYEGDIVETERFGNQEVVWNYGGFGLDIRGVGGFTDGYNSFSTVTAGYDKCKVIGSIYENPELIK